MYEKEFMKPRMELMIETMRKEKELLDSAIAELENDVANLANADESKTIVLWHKLDNGYFHPAKIRYRLTLPANVLIG